MLTTLSTPILLVLAGAVGILIGLLVSTIFRSDPKATGEESALPKKYVEQGYGEATRLYYSPATKRTITELDGDFYVDFVSLTPEQKKRILRILQAWQEWSGQASTTASSTPARPQQQPSVISSAAVAAAMPHLPADQSNGSGFAPQSLSAPMPTLAKSQAQPKQEPLTIVEQINDVLEKMLANTPDQKRGIHLMDNGNDGVLVWVGIEKFNGVDEVPYPEVQQLIRAAVAQWEAQTEAQSRAMNVDKAK